jgi:hypothetical protein
MNLQLTELRRLCTESVSDFNHMTPRPAPASKDAAAAEHLKKPLL